MALEDGPELSDEEAGLGDFDADIDFEAASEEEEEDGDYEPEDGEDVEEDDDDVDIGDIDAMPTPMRRGSGKGYVVENDVPLDDEKAVDQILEHLGVDRGDLADLDTMSLTEEDGLSTKDRIRLVRAKRRAREPRLHAAMHAKTMEDSSAYGGDATKAAAYPDYKVEL
mmetsp:Transcript_54434/g.119379  ORF Transcript_54434/g.119379 Transcript_54434/m.119379 type:complete len:168 (+) Transcript_54434:1-504(+)